jgi:uncharacterized protein (TIGR03067 family)
MRVAVLSLVAIGLVMTARGQEGGAKKSKLEGTWKVTSVMEKGKEKGPEDHTMIISGDTLTVKKGDEVVFKGTFKRDKTKKPREIDVTVTEGPEKVKGKVAKGIYELKDDTLKLCANHPGEEQRPTEFSAPENSPFMLITMKRESK